MQQARERYEQWVRNPDIHEDDRQQLLAIADDEAEIVRRFYQEIDFGTGGMRAIGGLGSALWNAYTIGRVMQGVATELLAQAQESGTLPSIVIGYDTRVTSREYAEMATAIMVENGIRTMLFAHPRPTAMISFSVRHFVATMGIVVTASHNPKEYNGFKIYGSDGGQLLPVPSRRVMEAIESVQSFAQIKRYTGPIAEHALVHVVDEAFDSAFIAHVLGARPNVAWSTEGSAGQDLVIAYTSLHGTGAPLMLDLLASAQYDQIVVDEEQLIPSGTFPTVHHPNPEDPTVMQRIVEVAKHHRAHIVLGTDPDCDRLAAFYRDEATGSYVALTGNQIGVLLCEYLCRHREQIVDVTAESGHSTAVDEPSTYFIVKTIVTSDLGPVIAQAHGVAVHQTLTGFKYIADKINRHHGVEQRHKNIFLFGYEESHGYLAGTYARDKDASVAGVLLCDVLRECKQQGITFADRLKSIYEQYGYYVDKTHSITLHGVAGIATMQRIMQHFRQQPLRTVGGVPVVQQLDYLQDVHGLPRENVLKFVREDGSWVCVRPSGTEPKIKVYFSAIGTTEDEAERTFDLMKADVLTIVDAIIAE